MDGEVEDRAVYLSTLSNSAQNIHISLAARVSYVAVCVLMHPVTSSATH